MFWGLLEDKKQTFPFRCWVWGSESSLKSASVRGSPTWSCSPIYPPLHLWPKHHCVWQMIAEGSIYSYSQTNPGCGCKLVHWEMFIKEGLKDWWQLYHISRALLRFRLGRPWATFGSFLATWEFRICSRRKGNFLLPVHFSVAHNSSAEEPYIRYK